ncbi:hypothetical protein BDC45DRAFT_448283 [Circinella umbellata]|nr:hypothetical protein BDC45DRAFT_448283 [Circinella umbellata]
MYSPFLYAVFINSLPQRLRGKHGRPTKYRPDKEQTLVSSLLYADGVVLLRSPSDIVHLLSIVKQRSKELGYRWHLVNVQL